MEAPLRRPQGRALPKIKIERRTVLDVRTPELYLGDLIRHRFQYLSDVVGAFPHADYLLNVRRRQELTWKWNFRQRVRLAVRLAYSVLQFRRDLPQRVEFVCPILLFLLDLRVNRTSFGQQVAEP
jgi:hypothetical protein